MTRVQIRYIYRAITSSIFLGIVVGLAMAGVRPTFAVVITALFFAGIITHQVRSLLKDED